MPPGKPIPVKTLIFTWLGIAGAVFILNDLLALINGGGIFSFVAAVRAVRSHVSTVDVDDSALRTIFVFFGTPIVMLLGVLLDVDLEKRLEKSFIWIVIIGFGLGLDIVYGPKIIEYYMVQHGYSRCVERDHSVGHHRGRIWLDNYVSAKTACAAEDMTES